MMKKILKTWMDVKIAQWTSPIWGAWVTVWITSMSLPVFGYPLQLILTTAGKAFLSPVAPLAKWAVRHYSINDDEMFFVACADCGRLFFISCIIISIIEFFIILIVLNYTETDKKVED